MRIKSWKIFTYFIIQNFSSINMFFRLHLIVWNPSPLYTRHLHNCSSILPPGIWSLENYCCVMNWPIVAVTPKQSYDNGTTTVLLYISLIERKLVFSAEVWSQVRVRKDLWVTDFYLRVDFCLCLRTSPRAKPFIKRSPCRFILM